jgi:Subtilase family/FlgD Ig-like domain
MKNLSPLLCLAFGAFSAASALAQTGDGYVGIYSDSLGTQACASVPQNSSATLYVIAKTAGQSATGITGAEFRIEVTNPSGWYLSYTPPGTANIAMGNPIDTGPDPNAGGGLNLGFPGCQLPSGGQVKLGTLWVFNACGGPTDLLVKRHSRPTNAGFQCALFVKCDEPYYTKLCMTTAPPDSCTLGIQKPRAVASGDPTVFTASLNEGGGDSGEPPSDPSREVLALFVPGIIQLPSGATYATLASTTIHSPEVESVLQSYSVTSIAKAFPDFEPADAVAVGRTGEVVRLQDLSEIYKLLLPEGGNRVLLAEDLEALVEEVGYAELNGRAVLNDCPSDYYFASHQWSLRNTGSATPQQPTCTSGADIQFCEAYAITHGNVSTKIGIIDYGVGPHDDLLGKVTGDIDASAEGHGTHVAGIAAAWTGGAGIAGVDGLAQIISKAVDSADSTASRVRAAAAEGAVVLNNSWSLPREGGNLIPGYNTVRGAFRDVYMLNCVAVASMDNQASSVPMYPAGFGQGIIAVGATDCNDQHASAFSNTGPHIDVAAPGVDIWSSVPESVDPLRYQYKTGTSQAAPQVSGLAGLLLGMPAGRNLYNDDVEQLIRLSADDVNSDVLPGFDEQLGMGRLNALRALQLLEYPYALYQETASGGSAVDSTALYTLWFHVPPDTNYQAGNYRVRRFEVRQNVLFPVTFDSLVGVWGRGVATTGYSVESGTGPRAGNWNMGWCEPVPGSITPSGCTLRTFVYDVSTFPNEDPIGWWPARYDSVQFGYSVLGTATLTDVGANPAETITLTPTLSSANPLRPGATITLAIPQAGNVRIDVFDVAGRRIRVLHDGQLPKGRHELQWNGLTHKGGSLAAGLYFVRLETDGAVVTRKVVVLE